MKYYLTTPIYYPSGKFHIGNTYTTLIADMIARYKRQRGFDTYFLTGLDEHGQKIGDLAEELKQNPQDYVDEKAKEAKELWKKLDISYDGFIRTTDEKHKIIVQKIFTKFLENEDIYLGTYTGKYCKPCETYYTERQLIDGKCPNCGRDVIDMSEEVYFFKMSKYVDKLKKHYEENPDFILPLSRKNELFNSFIEEGIEDLSVTRTTFKWGVSVKENPEHVIYVWLDALTNYITAMGYLSDDEKERENFAKYWPADLHIVGKDIIRFHAIYWPIFLIALDLPLPKQIYAHNFFMTSTGKMSKSKGNVIYPLDIKEEYGLDPLKYSLIKEMSYSHDGVFSAEIFVENYNNDLANDLGNLVQRTIGMINSYRNGSIENIDENFEDKDLSKYIEEQTKSFENSFEKFEFSKSLSEIWKIISRLNKYIDENKPWELSKEEKNIQNKESKNKNIEIDKILVNLVNSIRKVSILINPILTETSGKIFEMLNINENINYEKINNFNTTNIKVESNPTPIFARLDKEKEIENIEKIIAKK